MILASQSPRRLELMQSMGIDPQVMPADIVEICREDEKPLALVKRLAQEKAIAVCYKLMEQPNFEQFNNEIVLAADTIVWTDDGEVFGKPIMLKTQNICFLSFLARLTTYPLVLPCDALRLSSPLPLTEHHLLLP